jgi:YHS domain-containing protein
MGSEDQDLRPFVLHVEGSVVPLKDREFVTEVLARSPDVDVENALVLATPEQVTKLHDFLRVHDVTPAMDGIYVGHTGTWFALRHGAVTDSGQWKIPFDVLASLANDSASVESTAMPTEAAERDPVCGTPIKPGQEAANVTYQGQTYHFCSAECRATFLEAPSKYAKSSVSATGPASNN